MEIHDKKGNKFMETHGKSRGKPPTSEGFARWEHHRTQWWMFQPLFATGACISSMTGI